MRKILQKIVGRIREEPWKSVIWSMGKLFLGAELFYGSGWLAVPGFLLVPVFWKKGQRKKAESEKKQMSRQFKDALTSLSFCLEVGYSIENAIGEVIKELRLLYGEAGMVGKFQKIQHQISVNITVERAFAEFATESENEDIQYFSHVFSLAKRSGGNFPFIIRNTAERIGKKLEVGMEIGTIISGKKMEQQVMSLIPYAMIFYLRISAPEFILPLYGNPAGVMVMTMSLAVCLLAGWIAEKIIHIEV